MLTDQSRSHSVSPMTRGKPLSFDRAEVLGKAMELFWARGYEPLGVSELLEGMGIQRQSFYNTFGSKEELFIEAFELYCRVVGERFTALFASAKTPLGALHNMFDFLEGMVKQGGCTGCLIGNTIAEFGGKDSKVAQAAEGAVKANEDMLYGAFEAAIASGELPSARDPRAMAGTMIALNQGLALMSKSSKSEKELLSIVRTARELLLS